MNYLLATSAIEETWKNENDQKILFTGEWCRLYKKNNTWNRIDSAVLKYHWNDRDLLYKDFKYISYLSDKLLKILSKNLNELHQVKYSIKYWRIVLGPWINTFVTILLDKWISINNALSNYIVTKTIILDYDIQKLVSYDFDNFLKYSNTELWNHIICSKILEYLNFKNIDYIKPSKINLSEINFTYTNNEDLNINKYTKNIIKKVLNLLSKNNKYFFIETYLSKFDFLKLNFMLMQFPTYHNFSDEKIDCAFNLKFRDDILKNFRSNNNFENFLLSIFPLQIPKLYLEGYSHVYKKILNNEYPKKPSLIWTSNSLFSNDKFKIWCAHHVESGVPLFIGQHGGHYGQGKFSFIEDHELNICDYYFSWGWNKTFKKVLPIGYFKGPHTIKKQKNQDKVALIMSVNTRFVKSLYSVPLSDQWLNYMNNNLGFYKNLSFEIKRNTIVRLRPYDFGWAHSERLKDKFSDIQFDNSNSNIYKLFSKSKVVVSGWNATTYLESMSLNIPTIIFWNEDYFELNEESKYYFNLLKKCGIFHDNFISAAKQVENVWDDIDLWWNDSKVVNAKSKFLSQYAKKTDYLKTIINTFYKI